MRVVYGVPWIEIEVEFGSRPEGWKLFSDLNICIPSTKKSSENGSYEDGGGYCGPVRPLYYVEIPWDTLSEELQDNVNSSGSTFTDNNWNPDFKGEQKQII